ncbi:MAG TPA: hypothetical protein VIM11_15655 [Tepidisphaeraceae bacterium]
MKDDQMRACPKCGAPVEAGVATAAGLIGPAPLNPKPRLKFVIPGTPTSLNPITAIKQGLNDEPSARGFWLTGFRCSKCGLVELYATEHAIV